jgi:hypothetical protein
LMYGETGGGSNSRAAISNGSADGVNREAVTATSVRPRRAGASARSRRPGTAARGTG